MSGSVGTVSRARRVALYFARSFRQDYLVATRTKLPGKVRLGLVAGKYRALASIAAGRPGTFQVGRGRAAVTGIWDLGTMMSAIADVGNLARRCRFATPRPVIVDVGANIGQFCLAAKMYWPSAQVTCFEADPDVAAQLASNTRDAGGVTVVNMGLGSEPGMLDWYRHNRTVYSSFRPRLDRPGEVAAGDGGRMRLPVVRLDDATGDIGDVDLLKVDVEGFEYEVLAGAPALLARTRWLWVETGLVQDGGPSNLEMFDLVRRTVGGARIVDFGKPYGPGPGFAPECTDVLIDLGGQDGA